MITPGDQRPSAEFLRYYQDLVGAVHPSRVGSWPLLNGWNIVTGSFKGWLIAVFQDAAFVPVARMAGVGELTEADVGATEITAENRDAVRSRLEQHFNIGQRDGVLLQAPDGALGPDLQVMLQRHELAMGLAPMKIFLSHKGFDKPMVRRFKDTLELLGFAPWLDEDNMPAGTALERGILKGFAESCAAVFFITPKFKDEDYLATEVDYAISEKRKKGDKFAIITLVFGHGATKGKVPELLHTYVWKEPKSELEAIQEILRALPVHVGMVHWRLG